MVRRCFVVLAFLLAGCQRTPISSLDFKAADVGHRLVVQGTTSLPDEAPILVTLYKPPDERALLQGTAVARAHRFGIVLPFSPTVAAGPYALKVTFSPRVKSWSPSVVAAVGPHGEKLHGPDVHQDPDGNRVIEKVQPVWIGPAGV